MKAVTDIFKTIKAHLSRGRLGQASDGFLEAPEALDARVAAIEERNRAKDCICTKVDANGDFEIVKRLKESPVRKQYYVEVGGLPVEKAKEFTDQMVENLAKEAPKKAKKPVK